MTKLKWMLFGVLAAFLITFVVLCISVDKKNGTIREQKTTIELLTAQVDSLSTYNKQLAELNGISVTVEFNLKSTNVLGINTNNCQNMAKEIAQYTRGELIDSLNRK